MALPAPTTKNTFIAATGQAAPRKLGDWFGETLRDRAKVLDLTRGALATTLPIITFTNTVTPTAGMVVDVFPTNDAILNNVVAPLTNIGPGSGGYGSADYNGTMTTFEWWSDAPKMDMTFVDLLTYFDVFVDGKSIRTLRFETGGSGGRWILNLDWSGVRKARHYKIYVTNTAFWGFAVTAADSYWAPAILRPLNYVLGDSYTFGSGIGTNGLINGFAKTYCDVLGMDCLPDGIGSTGWLSTGANAPVNRILDDLLKRTRVPNYITFALGFNDAGGDMTALTTAYNLAVTTVQSRLPNAKMITLGPATPLGTTVNLTAVKAALSAAATLACQTFIDVSDIFTAGNAAYIGGDNIHPTQAGADYYGGRIGEKVYAVI